MNLSSVYRIGKVNAFTSISINDYGLIKAGKNRAHGYDDWGDLPHICLKTKDKIYSKSFCLFNTKD